ncbi:MAG TPA: cupin domain-containing protein [Planctomycetota bacterium]|nr:cupin domain-containing protein [Planctomycetota bacterium]
MSCEHVDRLAELALCGLPPAMARALQEHAAGCAECGAELASLRAVVGSFAAWPDMLEPPARLRARLASRIACEAGIEPAGVAPPALTEPEWTTVAPGISCKLLAVDDDRHLVSMLVRLAPNTYYPSHVHAAVEELHLLDGELWIDDRKLCAGDYNRAEPGGVDSRVWSETGCTCVLVTSTQDALR